MEINLSVTIIVKLMHSLYEQSYIFCFIIKCNNAYKNVFEWLFNGKEKQVVNSRWRTVSEILKSGESVEVT